MTPILNQNRIDYLFYHLNKNHFELSGAIKKSFCFSQPSENKKFIFFPLTSEQKPKPTWIEEVLILFPSDSASPLYEFDKNNNLLFNHDLLTSAFYLLSGFQELEDYVPDEWGRYPYSASLQSKYDFACIPMVNVYFDIISTAVNEYCHRNNMDFSYRTLWNESEFAFLLTHDIDRVDKWNIYTLFNELRKTFREGIKRNYTQLLTAIKQYLRGDNPYWSFKWMKEVEKQLNLNSVWFILPRGKQHVDAYYDVEEPRIRKLARILEQHGDIIGLHGTFNSWDNERIMQSNFKTIQSISMSEIVISRQHWLHFKYPETLRILEKLGIQYDSSWAFAEHHGWRNAYCLPFNPYDIERDRMMTIMELPLSMMDVTFLDYLGLDMQEVKEQYQKLITTCSKHQGLLVMLWHNNHLDEDSYPGIKEVYKTMLEDIARLSPAIYKIG